MTQQEIGYMLNLIDEWISELAESHLNEECRKSGADFFSYMKSKGLRPGYLAKLITEATGYNPSQLWTINDAELLRDAIFRYEASIQIDKHTNLGARRIVDHMWGSTGELPNDQ